MQQVLAISTQGLTKRFEHHYAVRDVDLQIQSGEVYGLIGPNGAGKTTLIRILAATEEPTLGEVYIAGEPLLRGQDNPSLKRQIGYLPDDFPLYDDLTVWDYLDYFAHLYQLREPHRTRRLHEILELVQLSHKRNSLIATLSRGMKQRLSLARTVIHEPTVLLLDEPVSGLDPIARVQFRDIIRTLQASGMTILISSHVLSDLAELCTSIGVMELGFLVESAPLADLYRRLSQQTLVISTLGAIAPLIAALKQCPECRVLATIPDQGEVRVQFTGSNETAADLLRSLVHAGIPLTQFHPEPANLESIFLTLEHQQTA
jgi:ABC-2 type transport system ATP-binding protein